MAFSRLICFDLGGVLIRLCDSLDETLACADLSIRDVDIDREFHLAHEQITDAHQTGQITSSAYCDQVSRLLGGVYTPSEVELIHAAWIRGPHEGTAELIEQLRQSGYETACLSNTNDAHWELIAEYPNVAQLDLPHASHLLGLAKPDPAIFQAMQRSTGRRADEILLFDDAKVNVLAAKAAGWDAVLIDPGQPTCAQIRRGLLQHDIDLPAATGEFKDSQ